MGKAQRKYFIDEISSQIYKRITASTISDRVNEKVLTKNVIETRVDLELRDNKKLLDKV